MIEERCPFCKRDPYHYVDIGVGYAPVAIVCCNLGIALYGGNKQVAKLLSLKQSGSPRKQARAKRMIEAMQL